MKLLCIAAVFSLFAVALPLVPSDLPALTVANPAVDNASAIEAWMAKGKRLPPGRYYVATTIDTTKFGCQLMGTARPAYEKTDIAWNPSGAGAQDNATVLIWNGTMDANQSLIMVRHANTLIEDIGLCGQPIETHGETPSPVTLVTLYDPGPPMQPVSNTIFNRVTFFSAQRAVYAAPGTHCDHVTLRDCITSYLNVPVTIDNNQSVSWFVYNLSCLGPSGDCVFDVRDGGRLKAEVSLVTHGFLAWGAIIKLGKPGERVGTKHTGFYDIYVTIDNTTEVTNTIVERGNVYEFGPNYVNIWGHAADKVVVGDPIKIQANSRFTVDIKRLINPDFVYPPDL